MEMDFNAEIIAQAIQHKGFALIDILQPCVSFNHVNTYQWYKDRVYKLDSGHNVGDKMAAFDKAQEWGEKIPIGIICRIQKPEYSDQVLGAADPHITVPHTLVSDFEAMMMEFC